MTIINDDSRVVNKLEASLTDDARVIIYDRHMFIVLATVDIPIRSVPTDTECVRNAFTNLKSIMKAWPMCLKLLCRSMAVLGLSAMLPNI